MAGRKTKKTRRRTVNRNAIMKTKNNMRSAMLIVLFLLVFSCVIGAGGMTLKNKNDSYKMQEAKLQSMIDEEKARSEEIDKLKDYVGTNEYIEEVAREKLGLVHDNEILFRAEE